MELYKRENYLSKNRGFYHDDIGDFMKDERLL